ncbi:MAG: multidrug efflux RND transporter permease subunit [Imperialibacter sp.]|uniref:efflux RND transporter permease subunit n=1 Tax=Imperialibacter sp. TaxID=2038411 RepID=UPI0032ECDA9E
MVADVFIKRPVTAIVISIVIVLVGLIAMSTLPISQYPDITPPTVAVSGLYIGADAETVEQTTTTAIETQINGTPGMTYMSSNSTSSGASGVTVTFDIGTNIDIATLDVQNRVSVAEPTLPEIVRRLGLTVRKRNPSIFMALALYSPEGTHDATFLGNFANIYMKDALLRVKGVGDIFSVGDDFGMRIWLDPQKLANLKITPAEVNAALQEQNLQISAGTIGSTPQASTQTFEFNILTNARISTVEDFEDIVVKTNPVTGNMVYLKDIARVELAKSSYGNHPFVMGKPASFVLLYLEPGANALEANQGVRETLAELKASFPKDVDYLIPLETTSVVEVSLKEVAFTLMEAMILVILVVFLFLQTFRATLIPILAIPVSLIGTFIFFIPFGFTINTLTLFAFVLAIGIVVDDAIVVVESIQHNMDTHKLSAKDATIKSMKEISAPVIAIALILAAVFVPVGFVPGIIGKLYQQFAITIAISVLISAFVALSLTPALCMLLLRPSDQSKSKKGLEWFFSRFNRWFDKVAGSYTNGVRKWIKGTPYVLVMMICLFVGLFFLFQNKSTGFIPTEDEKRFFVTYEMAEGTSTNRSIEMQLELQKRIMTLPSLDVVGGLAGLNILTFSNKSNVGTLFVNLKHWDERDPETESVEKIIGQVMAMTSDIKEARVLAIAPPPIPGLGRSSGFTFELLQTSSPDDIFGFEATMQKFIAAANQRPEIAAAYSFFSARTPAYQVDLDKEKAKKMGVNVAQAYSTLSTLLASSYVNDFNIYGRNFRVVTQADTVYRKDIDDIGKYFVKNSMGEMVPLSALITTKVIETPALISHYNIYRSAEILGTYAPGYSSGDALKALQEVAAEVLPNGYSYEFGGMSYEEVKAGNTQSIIFLVSIVFVFLFLAALYESWSIPFSVLFAVPIGAFGSILTLTFLPGLTNNIYAQIGLITLIGLAAKNAILIVEFAKERVDAGQDIIESTLEAVRLRLRPIIMTSLAFILGVLPLAISTGAGAEARKTIGWTVAGGMVAASSLAIFVVPVLYVAISKIAYRRRMRKAGAS